MAELEDDFRFADGEAVLIGDAAAQNERVVVQAEVLGVGENDFTEIDRLGFEAGDTVLHAGLLSGLFKDLAEVEEALARAELVGPQDKFAAQVLDRLDGIPSA